MSLNRDEQFDLLVANCDRSDLDADGARKFAPCPRNWISFMRLHPEWVGKLRYNEMSCAIEVVGQAPWNKRLGTSHADTVWQDRFELGVRDWFADKKHGLAPPPKADVKALVELTAYETRYHPVREWLLSLPPHDGVQRLFGAGSAASPGFFETYMDVQPELCLGRWSGRMREYLAVVTRCFFVNAVKRVMEPGCEAQYVLTLQSRKKGIGKQRWMREGLMPRTDWFRSPRFNIRKPEDMQRLVQGVWVVLWDEFVACSDHEFQDLKAFLTNPDDDRVPKWREFAEKYQRTSVIYAATNKMSNLLPEADRRFQFVKLGNWIDVDGIAAVREQVWAEAVELYRSGAQGFPTEEEQRELCDPVQADRAIENTWVSAFEDKLEEVLARGHASGLKPPLKTTDILSVWCDIPLGQQNRTHEQRVAEAMESLGWYKGRGYRDGRGRRKKQVTGWRPPNDQEEMWDGR